MTTEERPHLLWFQTLLKRSWSMYVLVLLGSVFGGGSLIRLYGNTCGLSLLDPYSWFGAIISIGSPWCRALNWVGYMTTSIVEHLWFHLFGMLITGLLTFVPGKFTSPGTGQYNSPINSHSN